MITMTITTKNPEWGFYGTTRLNYPDWSQERIAGDFDAAASTLTKILDIEGADAARVLDSRVGRHLADERRPSERAEAVICRCMIERGWQILVEQVLGETTETQYPDL